MAQQVKMLAIKPSDLSSIPKIHMVENTNSPKFSSDLHRQAVTYIVKKEKYVLCLCGIRTCFYGCMCMCTFAIRPEGSINCLPQLHLTFLRLGHLLSLMLTDLARQAGL